MAHNELRAITGPSLPPISRHAVSRAPVPRNPKSRALRRMPAQHQKNVHVIGNVNAVADTTTTLLPSGAAPVYVSAGVGIFAARLGRLDTWANRTESTPAARPFSVSRVSCVLASSEASRFNAINDHRQSVTVFNSRARGYATHQADHPEATHM